MTRLFGCRGSKLLPLSSEPVWFIAETHCKASVVAERIQSTLPRRNLRVEALSYVAVSLPYNLCLLYTSSVAIMATKRKKIVLSIKDELEALKRLDKGETLQKAVSYTHLSKYNLQQTFEGLL